jgi:hypothetical protein
MIFFERLLSLRASAAAGLNKPFVLLTLAAIGAAIFGAGAFALTPELFLHYFSHDGQLSADGLALIFWFRLILQLTGASLVLFSAFLFMEKRGHPVSRRLYRSVTFFLIVIWFINAGLVTWCMVRSLQHPDFYGWNESQLFAEASAFSKGQCIYGDPEKTSIPYFYTPGFQLVCAGLFKLFGPSIFLQKMVALSASLLTCLLCGWIAWRSTKTWFWTFFCALLYFSFYHATGDSFDVPVNDTLVVFLSLAAIAAVLSGSASSAALGGILCALALGTKQTSLAIFVLIGTYLAYTNLRRFLVFLAAVTVVFSAFFLPLYFWSDGWIWHWIFSVTRDLSSDQWLWLSIKLTSILSLSLAPLLLVAGIICFHTGKASPFQKQLLAWLWFAAGSFFLGMVATTKPGTNQNHFLYFAGCLTVLLSLSMASLAAHAEKSGSYSLLTWAILGLLAQAPLSWIDPVAVRPLNSTAAQDSRDLVKHLREHPGRAVVPRSPHYSVLAGKEIFDQDISFWILHQAHQSLPQRVLKQYAEGTFDEVFVEDETIFGGVFMTDSCQLTRGFPPEVRKEFLKRYQLTEKKWGKLRYQKIE